MLIRVPLMASGTSISLEGNIVRFYWSSRAISYRVVRCYLLMGSLLV